MPTENTTGLPASLQALKDHAKAVREDGAAIESAKDAAWRAALIAAARENLGDLWQYTDGRPSYYRPSDACFEIRLPGHRTISAHFSVLNSGHGFWARVPYYAGTAADVKGEHAWWLVDRAPGKDLPTYYHTLGGALVAAEE